MEEKYKHFGMVCVDGRRDELSIKYQSRFTDPKYDNTRKIINEITNINSNKRMI